jgi:catechol 2,3-dioxygenase
MSAKRFVGRKPVNKGTIVNPRLQHIGVTTPNIDILPVLCTDAGAQAAFYYEDPDHNSVELNMDNYGDSWTSGEHLRHSPEFARNPMGHYIDPEKLLQAGEAGATPSQLSARALKDELVPVQVYDPRVLL